MGIEFALVARVRTFAVPFDTDAVIDFHRQIGYAGLLLVMVHVAMSADWRQANPFTPSNTPPLVWFGAIAAGTLIAVVTALVHVLLVNYQRAEPRRDGPDASRRRDGADRVHSDGRFHQSRKLGWAAGGLRRPARRHQHGHLDGPEY